MRRRAPADRTARARPGAGYCRRLCQKDAYVGRDGLDCCDSNKMSLGGLGRECTNYTVKK